MKNFDELLDKRRATDRTFRLRGSEFTAKPGVPFSSMAAVDAWALMDQSDQGEALPTLVARFVEEPTFEAFLRAKREADQVDAITFPDEVALLEWLIGITSGRPFALPNASPPSSETPNGGTASTATPASQVIPL
jgi:hypothetical protein